MGKIRILIVDDSVVIRRLVSDVLSGDPAIQVVGAAANGRIALAKIPQVNPDLVTLDVEMPEMNGLETLAVMRKQYPHLPVIMFSTVTERGAAVTLDALSMGASDYVTKPANVGSVGAGMQRIREELIPKIKALCAGKSSVESRESSVTYPIRTEAIWSISLFAIRHSLFYDTSIPIMLSFSRSASLEKGFMMYSLAPASSALVILEISVSLVTIIRSRSSYAWSARTEQIKS